MSSKVSVIMGIYNCEATLAEAIESILSQTYQNFEMILCDDGSTDETYHVANQYASNHDNIILLKNERNMGLNFTLNKCLKSATGDYIARMDGDDISSPERFEKEVTFLDSHPEFAIVSTAMKYFDETGIWRVGEINIVEPEIKDFVRHAPFHCHAPCMIRREAYLAVGGYTEDKRLLRYEDCNLWYKLYAAGYRGYNINEPLYMMRDDRSAAKRRTKSSRLRAVYVQYTGFKLVKMPIRYYPYLAVELVKQIILILLPINVYSYLHRKRNK